MTPLREGGSLPGLVEADNLDVRAEVPRRGARLAGAGRGDHRRRAGPPAFGLRTRELALTWLDPRIAASEPDEEIQDLLRASEGLNLGVDFLPGSAGFDPLGWTACEAFASELLGSTR